MSADSKRSAPSNKSNRAVKKPFAARTPASEAQTPLLQEKRYVEEPIGDPRRRPRWGVPCRLDIHRLVLSDVQLWVLDLLMMDAHTTAQLLDSGTTRIDVKSLTISKSRLEAGDDRKAGSVDGIRGVYLGELIWCVVGEVIPLVVTKALWATSRTAALAAGYIVKDGAKRIGAHAVQKAHAAGHALKEGMHHLHPHAKSPTGTRSSTAACRVHVHLISGRQVTRKGYSVNSHALLELLDSNGHSVAQARSAPQMWTKVPHWDEAFELTPSPDAFGSPTYWSMRLSLYHQKSRQVVGITHHSTKENPDRFIGEVLVPLMALLIQDPVIASGGEIVGWFPLTDTRCLRQGTPCSGELKMGFRVEGVSPEAHEESPRHSQLLHKICSGFAIMHP